MTSYLPSESAVFSRLFDPVVSAYADSKKQYRCIELPDLDFLEMGVSRCLSDSRTGRDFIQRHGDNGRTEVSVSLFFKSLSSARRLENARSINLLLAPLMAQRCEDPFAAIPELDDFDLFAGDGHYHGAAAHDPKILRSNGKMKKLAVGHFFMLDFRTHHLDYLALGQQGGTRKGEHDMRVIKRAEIDALRGGKPKGRKVILVWDRAGIDFKFWHKAKHSSGLYFLSREKENMKLVHCGDRPIDHGDKRNAGVIADEVVESATGGVTLRRITYINPIDGTTYTYITTENTLPPGVLVLLYKHRWDIEKVFDELKSKLYEKKAWGSSRTAKEMQAQFLCLTHNLMVLLERDIESEESITNTPERQRRNERKARAQKHGTNFIGTAIQRFTVRSLKFVRWLRNLTYREAPWAEAIARLRQIYATF
jgi:hypothetical protein